VVAVGDSAEIELVYRAGRPTGRPANKKATVTTNDNSQGTFRIEFRGDIYMEADSTHLIAIEPKLVNFHEENRDDKIKVKVYNQTDEKLKMRLVSHPHGFLKVDVSGKDIKPGKDREIKVEIDDDFEGRRFAKSFTIELSDSAHTRYTIPVGLETPAESPRAETDAASGRRPEAKEERRGK
jgi:hypothetical protein